MARIARVVAVGYPHHITQRGNNRQPVFSNDADREKYLTLVKTYSQKYHQEILAYCLMTNHVHFIVISREEETLAKAFNFTHMRYSQYYNKKMGMSGHLWQGRFYSCVMDEKHVYAGVRYIERNPVRAKMVKKPWEWRWSSARAHCEMEREDRLGVNRLFKYIEKDGKWAAYIAENDLREDMELIRKQTRKGLPIGNEGFIKKLENKLARAIRAMPRGRPKKKKIVAVPN